MKKYLDNKWGLIFETEKAKYVVEYQAELRGFQDRAVDFNGEISNRDLSDVYELEDNGYGEYYIYELKDDMVLDHNYLDNSEFYTDEWVEKVIRRFEGKEDL